MISYGICLSLSDLTSLSMIISSYTMLLQMTSFILRPSDVPLYVCTSSLSIHLPVDTHVVLMFGAIVNSLVMNIGVRISLSIILLYNWKVYTPMSGITGYYGNSLFILKVSGKSNWPVVSFTISVALWIFCLENLSIDVSEV